MRFRDTNDCHRIDIRFTIVKPLFDTAAGLKERDNGFDFLGNCVPFIDIHSCASPFVDAYGEVALSAVSCNA